MQVTHERAWSSWCEGFAGAMPASWAPHGQRHNICVGTWMMEPTARGRCLFGGSDDSERVLSEKWPVIQARYPAKFLLRFLKAAEQTQ
jgi:hypothetical protein